MPRPVRAGQSAPATTEFFETERRAEYQSARGLEATGVMNAITADRLFEDHDMIEKLKLTNAISLPGLVKPIWSGTRGTWVILESESAFPLQSSKISCDQTAGACKETIVEFMGSVVSVQEVEYAILSWNATGVRAISSTPLCVDHVIQIQKVEKKDDRPGLVTGYRAKKRGQSRRPSGASPWSRTCRGASIQDTFSWPLDPPSSGAIARKSASPYTSP